MKLKNIAESELIPGGLSSGKPDSHFDPDALAKGIKVELEHTSDKRIAKEIAKDHLSEDPKYYDKLAKMEESKGKKDACYYKVKKRYKVWPSAFASGALEQCRSKGADNWGNKS